MISTISSRVTPCSVSGLAKAGAAVNSAIASTAAKLKCFIATPPEVKRDYNFMNSLNWTSIVPQVVR